ncbi:hypothetical protein D3C78_1925410 [compost metagenome]
MVGSNGKRNQAIATKAMATIANGNHFPHSGNNIFNAVESNKPAAAAANPANTCCTWASSW